MKKVRKIMAVTMIFLMLPVFLGCTAKPTGSSSKPAVKQSEKQMPVQPQPKKSGLTKEQVLEAAEKLNPEALAYFKETISSWAVRNRLCFNKTDQVKNVKPGLFYHAYRGCLGDAGSICVIMAYEYRLAIGDSRLTQFVCSQQLKEPKPVGLVKDYMWICFASLLKSINQELNEANRILFEQKVWASVRDHWYLGKPQTILISFDKYEIRGKTWFSTVTGDLMVSLRVSPR